jgi:hypothetical protein
MALEMHVGMLAAALLRAMVRLRIAALLQTLLAICGRKAIRGCESTSRIVLEMFRTRIGISKTRRHDY